MIFMYDNLNFGLRSTDVSNVNFLEDVPQYLDTAEQINFESGTIIKGTLGDTADKNYFEVTVSSLGINLRNGSLCKYHFGNNLETLTRQETQNAIGALSDTLHLNLDLARMYRIDLAQNFCMQYSPEIYFSYLGQMLLNRKQFRRATDERGSLYYYGKNEHFIFYDKLKEQKDKGKLIPKLYTGRNLLRIEHRFISRLYKMFNCTGVTAAMLYNEDFYIGVINKWFEAYQAIRKQNEIGLNFEFMKTKKDFYTLLILEHIKNNGSELALMEQIQTAQQTKQLSKKMAFDIRAAITKAVNTNAAINAPNELILELDKKVNEARKHYR
ncbi:MAG: hypothetical protein KF900_07170 [Bacteroidetes bacterium]|nr:hypothetical protein [Bacteroidota bacterium]